MKSYVAVLGRQPLISVAELESLFEDVKLLSPMLAMFRSETTPDIRRLGGTLKIATPIKLDEFFNSLPESGKITIGVSDFSKGTSAYVAQKEALKIKQRLKRAGRSARAVSNKDAILSSATSIHNRLFTNSQVELIKNGREWYRVLAVQDISSYAQRDQGRPARDAKVGMLPPKLAQILLNLCGDLPVGSRVLDPFCGTGVVLQEAALMGYVPYGTDLSERMVSYSQRNLKWLCSNANGRQHHETMRDQRQSLGLNGYKQGNQATEDWATEGKSAPHTSIVAQIDRKVNTSAVDARRAFDDSISSKRNLYSGNEGLVIDVAQGDATTYQWKAPIDAVACETYLGPPMSLAPAEIKLRQAKQECKAIILGFLKNLAEQIQVGVPVAIAVPAWLRPDGSYERLNLLDEIEELRYNVRSFKNLGQDDLLYHRDGQVVAREIIVLRKK